MMSGFGGGENGQGRCVCEMLWNAMARWMMVFATRGFLIM